MSAPEIIALLRFARIYSAEKLPWFSPALFACRIHLSEAVGLAAISTNFDLFFNPKAIAQIAKNSNNKEETLAQLGFLWIHEISHVLREHAERSLLLQANPSIWNLAAELEINDSHWEGLKMPPQFTAVYPHQYGFQYGQIAEKYYQQLTAKKTKTNAIQNPILDEGSGVHGQTRPWELQQQTNNNNESEQNKPEPIKTSKSNKTPISKSQKTEIPDKQQDSDQAQPSTEMTEMQKTYIRREVARGMQKLYAQSKSSSSWQRWAEEKLHSKIDWRPLLRQRICTALVQGVGMRSNYSYARPNRRQAAYLPILPPSLTGNVEPRIACIIDTSASMSSVYISQAIAEVFHILNVLHVPITVIPCDTKAYKPIKISLASDRFKLLKIQGGNGTDMIVGINAALQLKPKPDAVLVLTDGHTPYPDKPHQTPIIFGIIKSRQERTPPLPNMPPWNKTSVVEILLDA